MLGQLGRAGLGGVRWMPPIHFAQKNVRQVPAKSRQSNVSPSCGPSATDLGISKTRERAAQSRTRISKQRASIGSGSAASETRPTPHTDEVPVSAA